MILRSNDTDILISWLSEYEYCPRRFYLKTYEKIDGQNIYLAEGTADHTSVHAGKIQKRRDVITVMGLYVYSGSLGLRGICDMVEFKKSRSGVYVPFLDECCEITPIEYKHGKKRDEKEYNIQICAQALCIEEMYGCNIDRGFIYYTTSRQRFEVSLDNVIKDEVKTLCQSIRGFMLTPVVPEAVYKKRCPRCSIYDICSPKNKMISKYMDKLRKGTL